MKYAPSTAPSRSRLGLGTLMRSDRAAISCCSSSSPSRFPRSLPCAPNCATVLSARWSRTNPALQSRTTLPPSRAKSSSFKANASLTPPNPNLRRARRDHAAGRCQPAIHATCQRRRQLRRDRHRRGQHRHVACGCRRGRRTTHRRRGAIARQCRRTLRRGRSLAVVVATAPAACSPSSAARRNRRDR